MAKYNVADRPEVSPEQMYEIATRVAEKTFADQALTDKLLKSGMLIQFKYYDAERWGKEIEAMLTVDCSGDRLEIITGPCEKKPDVEMSMEAYIAHLFWMQKLQLMSAITRGQMKVKGPIPKLMRLLPLMKPFYANYRLTLEDLGRADLLAWPAD